MHRETITYTGKYCTLENVIYKICHSITPRFKTNKFPTGRLAGKLNLVDVDTEFMYRYALNIENILMVAHRKCELAY